MAAAPCAEIEQRYGVDPAIVVSVWGVESNFGRITGSARCCSRWARCPASDGASISFAASSPPRCASCRTAISRPHQLKGSWAGAFGQTQFMPGTFLTTAVDFDGDGRRDLIDSVPDALASTANFLHRAGYRTGERWGMEVALPPGYAGPSGRRARHDVAYWRAHGLKQTSGKPLPGSLPATGLLLPAGNAGPAFLVGRNFDTLYRYNASEHYALAIAQLSTLVADTQAEPGFATPWPTDDPGLSRAQNRELQTLLLQRGHAIGEADGVIGDHTRDAIRTEQRRLGMPVDGRAGQKLLKALRAH